MQENHHRATGTLTKAPVRPNKRERTSIKYAPARIIKAGNASRPVYIHASCIIVVCSALIEVSRSERSIIIVGGR